METIKTKDIPVQGAEVVTAEKQPRKMNVLAEIKRWGAYIKKFEDEKVLEKKDLEELKAIYKRAVQKNISMGLEL